MKIGARVLDLRPDNSFGPQTSNVKVLGSKTFSLWNAIKICMKQVLILKILIILSKIITFYSQKVIRKPHQKYSLVPIHICKSQMEPTHVRALKFKYISLELLGHSKSLAILAWPNCLAILAHSKIFSLRASQQWFGNKLFLKKV